MAQYSTKRTYTKKPSTTKKVVKKIKKEVVDVVEAVQKAPQAVVADSKSVWQKAVNWVKGLVS